MAVSKIGRIDQKSIIQSGYTNFRMPGWLIIMGALLCVAAAYILVAVGFIEALFVMTALFAILLIARPFIAFCLIISLIGFEALNTIQTGQIYSITAIKMVGLILVVSLLPNVALRRIRFRFSMQSAVILFFLLSILASFLKAAEIGMAVSASLTYLQLAVLWFAVHLIVDDHHRLDVLAKIAVITLSISALVAIFQFMINPAMRITGISQNAAVLSADLYVAIGFGIALTLLGKRIYSKVFWLALTAICFGGILFSLSRAAYLAFIPALLVGGLFMSKKALVILLVILIICFVMIFTPFVINRLAETSPRRDLSTMGHIMSIQAGIKMMADNPFLGVGVGNYERNYLRYTNDPRLYARTPHNSYLAIGSEMGIFSLLAFLFIHAAAYRGLWVNCRNALRNGDRYTLVFSAVIAAAITAFVIIGMFHTLQINKYLWILLALAVKFPEEPEPETAS